MKIRSRIVSGFTLIEMLIIIAIISILAALIMPALKKALDTAYKISCANNQKQLGYAYMSYTDDNRGLLPPADAGGANKWMRLICTYVELDSADYYTWCFEQTIFTCPTGYTLHPERCINYAQNKYAGSDSGGAGVAGTLPRLKSPKSPSKTFLMDGAAWNAAAASPYWFSSADTSSKRSEFVHAFSTNVLFFDMHVESLFDVEFPTGPGSAADKTFWAGE